ncbi:MAG: response regulator [Verrucomicrobiales bacterium]|nr:response regulator [Verrucomicrobiales bacterium]
MNAIENAPTQKAAIPATPRILIVDDEQPMQVLASSIVKKIGYEPQAVDSGEAAVEAVRSSKEKGSPYAVVVMDLALPGGMSGLEATIAIKQIDADAKVIVCSGYLEQNARSAALEHGFAGILPKPYTADRLTSELRHVLK